ncbi:N-acetylgalactosamine-6-O-sulfatase [Sinobacterium norvegicum]|uniref:N-acetylgalactosamine-6-O-sulfatase n=1 Tax=Sinobacterium norvegicum TaxID=1641715 RepID=A0ABN8EHS9_9GAMM|nr:sulfatase-like hydrolase/transferase [Sinobacterium norvegicum]CAH0990669.1 N-acetylgalactosamine-6-O-sulfatase [Sinobacterium norvegicum]
MKKLFTLLLAITIAAFIGWQNRIELVVWGAPIAAKILRPVGPNVPTQWQQGPATASVEPNQRPPNIIVILTDDMGFNDISLYNGGAADGSVMTPNIDAIAQQGVRFDKGYAANAICAPSRATLLTGRYSTRFGFEYTPIFKLGPRIFSWMDELEPRSLPLIIDTDTAATLPPVEDLGMPASEITIAEVLQQQDYYTAHIGKWHVGSLKGMRPEDQGFDDSLYMKGTLYLPENHPDVVNAKIEGDAIDRMIWAAGGYAAQFNGGEPFEPQGYLTDYYTDEAVKVIEANRNRPFFLYLAHWGLHNPIQATRADYDAFPLIEDHTLRVYAGMMRALDRSIEKITSTLEANGLADNTLVIFTSDNGGAGYIGLPDINKPYRGWKLTHFEGGTHVPFMAKWPNTIPAGTQYTEAIHQIDLFSTIAAAAGAEVPTDRIIDGVNLMPYILGESTGVPHKTLFWRQGHQQTVLHEGWKLIRADQPEQAEPSQKKFLFHLAADPTEQVNLLQQRPDKVAQLEALLATHNAEQAAPAWPSVLQAPQLIDKTTNADIEPDDVYLYWPN